MTFRCALIAAILLVPALGEKAPTGPVTGLSEPLPDKGDGLMAKGPGRVLEHFQLDGLNDPFDELSDDFDVESLDCDESTAPVAGMAPRAAKSTPVTEAKMVLPVAVGDELGSGFSMDRLLYLVCVFIVELLVVFVAAGVLQWWRTAMTLEVPQKRKRTIETKDECGCTALHAATNSGSVIDVHALLDNGADVDSREAWEETPLHFGARVGSVEVCELLLKHGATVNPLNSQDQTPLLVAGCAGNEGVCNLLLDYGAHVGGVKDDEMPMLLASLLTQRIFNNSGPVEAS